MDWFLSCLDAALGGAKTGSGAAPKGPVFGKRILARVAGLDQASALLEIDNLVRRDELIRDSPGHRSACHSLKEI